MSNNTLTIQTVTITPEMAAKMLPKNVDNRTVSKSLVKRLKLSMERDEWVLNGEAIKIADDGRILDGQHRLISCVETGHSFTTVLMTGLPSETQFTMDTGKARTLRDMLTIRGEKNTIGLSATIGVIMRAERWGLKAAAMSSTGDYALTIKESLEYLDANPWLRDLEREGEQLRCTGLTQKLAAMLLHTFRNIDEEDAQHFFDRLVDGAELSVGDPILTLRNWLQTNRTNLLSSGTQGERGHGHRGMNMHLTMTAYTIKAWNAYRDGVPLKQLKFRIGGANPETFPEPR